MQNAKCRMQVAQTFYISSFIIHHSSFCISPQSLVHFRPVHDVPPRRDVIGPAVLILQVVRMLPDVDAEDDLLAFHQRTVLVRGALDDELAALIDHPGPAAAEASGAGLADSLLERVE